jgi:hypothetical protein
VNTPRLVDVNGRLCLPNGDIIVLVYPEGDCDTFDAQNPDIKKLRSALYDCREMGELDCTEVTLPNGLTVRF